MYNPKYKCPMPKCKVVPVPNYPTILRCVFCQKDYQKPKPKKK